MSGPKDRDQERDDEMYQEMLDDARRENDPDVGVKCISCMDDPTLCRMLGVCDEREDDDFDIIFDI